MYKKFLSLFLAVILAFSNISFVFALDNPENSSFLQENSIIEIATGEAIYTQRKIENITKSAAFDQVNLGQAVLSSASSIYFENNKAINNGFEEIGTIFALKNSINGYIINDYDYESTIGSIYTKYFKGESILQDLYNLANSQGEKGNFGVFEDYIPSHAWAMILLSSFGIDYDVEKAINYLQYMYETEVTIDYSGYIDTITPANDFVSADDAGIYLLALSPYKDSNAIAGNLVNKAVNYLKDTQIKNTPNIDTKIANGGWAYYGSYSVNSTAYAIMGLCSVGEDIGNWEYPPIISLASWQAPNGQFLISDYNNYGSYIPDAYATKQAIIAIYDFVNGESFWKELPNKSYLVPVYTLDDLQFFIKKAKKYNINEYTSTSYNKLKIAIENAEKYTINNSNAIGELIKAIENGISGLVKTSGENSQNTYIIEIAGYNNTILRSTNYKSDETNGFEVFKQVCEENNIEFDYTGSGNSIYITGINGLYEFDYGVTSGWKYSINGVVPNNSIGNITLANNDNFRIYYTETADLEGNENNSSGSTLPTIVTGTNSFDKYNNETIVKIDEDITHNLINLASNFFRNKLKTEYWSNFYLVVAGESYNDEYCNSIINKITETNGKYRLTTDMARDAILLQMNGYDLENIGGVNLLNKILNNKEIGKQGVNGYIYTLIVLENNKNILENKKNELITEILAYQNEDGGFGLGKDTLSEIDITAMALTSLALFKGTNEEIDNSILNGLMYLENTGKIGYDNSESISQIIIALASLGISPDSKYFYEDNTLIEELLKYKTNEIEFKHKLDGEWDTMATEQAYLAIKAYDNFYLGLSPIYSYKDNKFDANTTLINKVNALGILEDPTIELLNQTASRGEFLQYLGYDLDIAEEYKGYFSDVSESDKYEIYEYFYENNIVSGYDNGSLGVNDNITLEDTMVILNRAGIFDEKEVINTEPFEDIDNVNSYAIDSIKKAVEIGIISVDSDPKEYLTNRTLLELIINE